MIFKGKRSGIFHILILNVDPSFTNIENFRGGFQSYMMERKDFISNFSFEIKNKNGLLVSFNGESIAFRTSIKNNHFHIV